MFAEAILFVLLVIFLLQYFRKEKGNLPPGPTAYPLVGNLIQLGKLPHLKFTEWSKVYGKIFLTYFGPNRMIVLNDPTLIREAFNEPSLSGRIDFESFNLLSDGPHGVINSYGKEWIEQRRFTLRNLRDFGFGKNTMERFIMDEITEFLDALKSKQGEPVNIGPKFIAVVLNSLWMILTGKRYEHSDKRLTQIFDDLKDLNESTAFSPAFFFPSFAKKFPKLTKWDEVMKIINGIRTIVIGHINEHQINRPEDGIPRDFMDAYLKEVEGTQDQTSSFHGEAGIKSLQAVSADLFIAGSDTTSQSLTWLVLYMCKHPEVQKNLQKELDTVIGKNRLVTLSDRPSLPYTEATLNELARIASIAAMGVFHTAMEPCMEDTKLEGYDIPKGSWICSNFHGVHHSKEIWGDPEKFRPERFLSADGKTVIKHDALMPFSVGKRVCLGETLARDTMFLFTTSLFQRFDIKLADDSLDVTYSPKPGIVLSPQDFNVILTERI